MGTYVKNGRHRKLLETVSDDTFFQKYGFTRTPQLVQWMVTLQCPLKCSHCLAVEDEVSKEMSLKEVSAFIEEIATLGVNELLLTGGEPLVRPDLPKIIDILRANHIRWSLNTAISPTSEVKHAIEKWPPNFVAVSLDGPPEIHDEFRGCSGAFRDALESLSYFAQIVPTGVTVGTTVTTKNFPYLSETFAIIIESSASAWGLHLVVPEGRAAWRNDLFLSRNELKKLLRFAAAKRNHFPVTIADEIGYCGYWEPLVRDNPFFCGAGKAQCVILPDGEVVPCTTLDKSASAGNIQRQSLREIWENGFPELRQYKPEGKCTSCQYAVACKGGCWLQRRHGTQCFKETWHLPKTVTSAGLAVCLGLTAAGYASGQEPVKEKPVDTQQVEKQQTPSEEFDESKMEILQRHIIQWYASGAGGYRAPTEEQIKDSVKANISGDPAAKYFLSFIDKERPKDIIAISKQIEDALKTKQRSLCLINLAWRDIMEWQFNKKSLSERSADENEALRNVLILLGKTADDWRKEIFEKKLDPFLRRPKDYRYFFLTKGGPGLRPPSVRLETDLAKKRGWTSNEQITKKFLEEHPYAEIMELSFESDVKSELQKLSKGQKVPARNKIGVFDLLIIPQMKETKQIKVTFKNPSHKFDILLPTNAEFTYGDILCLIYEQNKDTLDKIALSSSPPIPMVLPALHELRNEIEYGKQDTKDLEPEITRLIKQLGDADWETRESAQNKLYNLDTAVISYLKAESQSTDDPEVRMRTNHILKQLQEKLAPKLRQIKWILADLYLF